MKHGDYIPSFDNYMDRVQQVLRSCIDHGYALELNAAGIAGWQKKVGPPQSILYEYKRMGRRAHLDRFGFAYAGHRGTRRRRLREECTRRRLYPRYRVPRAQTGADRTEINVEAEITCFLEESRKLTHADTTVRARAKINLTLDVTGRREDGYHTVEMVMAVDRAARYRARYHHSRREKAARHRAELQPAVSADRRAQSGVPCGGAVLQGDRRTTRNLRDSYRKAAFRLRQVWQAARRTRRLYCVRSTHCIQLV